jgi:hypothetical protein
VTGAGGAARLIFAAMRLGSALRLLLASAVLTLGAAPPCCAKRQVVLELYTSQGCSSCPPADALIGRLAERADLLALSLPVTYWDMLGWKDTLASEANTRRQKSYAAAMGRGGVYTPQIIVEGVADVVGSREAQVEAAISARRADLRDLPVSVSASPEAVHIAIGSIAEKSPGDATVWLLHVLSRASVRVAAGENKGRNMDYRNVVRDIRAVAIWKGQPLSLDVPRVDQGSAPYDSIAVLVQEGGYGRVVGARLISASEYNQ